MSLLRHKIGSGNTYDYGPTRTLQLYTGTPDTTGDEPGAALADQYADCQCNPWRPSPEGTPTLIWLPGDELRTGSPSAFRRFLYEEPREYLATVSLPLGNGLDMVGLEPRFVHTGGPKTHVPDMRFELSGTLPEQARLHLQELEQTWAVMKLAMHRAVSDPIGAAGDLGRLARLSAENPFWSGLAMRNQAAALIRAGEAEAAFQLLTQARSEHEGYRDLDLLLAWLLLEMNEDWAAQDALKTAGSHPADPAYFHAANNLQSSIDWLRSRVMRRSNLKEMAFSFLLRAIIEQPWSTVYMMDMVRLAPPGPMLRDAYKQLLSVCWRYAFQVPLVVKLLSGAKLEYLAIELLNGLPLSDEQRAALSPAPAPASPSLVTLEGDFVARHSLSRVNRMLAIGLRREGINLGLVPTRFPTVAAERLPELAGLAPAFDVSGTPAVTIRHGWPHNFSAPHSGKLVMIMPWEFGSLPKEWFHALAGADQIWVYTTYLRDLMIKDGLPADRLVVVPLAVDQTVFHPHGESRQLAGAKGFSFLFVGGTIPRKGVDLLVEAYCQEFSPSEDVTLVIKDFGSGSMYSDALLANIEARMKDAGTPHILIERSVLSDEDLAAYYRGCGALVHPYRGEGFGLPIAEAMGCGAPVIVTGAGAAVDFCHDDVAYLVPAVERAVPAHELEHWAAGTMRRATWHEVHLLELRKRMRHVFTHRDEARARGRAAAEWVARELTWERTGAVAATAIRGLLTYDGRE